MNLLDRVWESRWKAYLLPFALCIASVMNFGLYYVGLAYEDNIIRSTAFIIGQLVFAIFEGLSFLAAIKHAPPQKSFWLYFVLTAGLFAGSLVAGLIHFGPTSETLGYTARFLCMGLPAGLAGIAAARSRAEQKFLPLMEQISFYMFPGGLIYFFGLMSNANPFGYGRSLGIMDYMFVSYAIMPFLLVHIICMADGEPLMLPILNRPAAHPQWIRGVFIAVYWIATIGAATRGTYVCIAGFCVLLVIGKALYRKSIKKSFVISAIMAAVMLFNLFIYAPPGMYGVGRMQIFLEGLAEGKIVTSTANTEGIEENLDALVSAENGQQVVVSKPEEPPTEDPTEETPQNPEDETPTEPEIEPVVIENRGTMYRLAWMEFLKSPIIGMGGAGSWAAKYGGYPHNAILQVLCETGLLGFIPFFALVFIAIFRILKAAKTNRKIRYVLLIFMAYAIRANISGCIWYEPYLLCALGFGLAYPLSKKQESSSPSEKEN